MADEVLQPPSLPTAVPLRRNRDFLLLWSGQAVSALGSSMAAIVYPLITLAVSRSVVAAGVVAFAGAVTTALLRLPAGVLIDLWPRKPIMVAADVGRALSTAAIAVALVTGHLTLGLLVVMAVIGAACGALSEPAHGVAVRHLVPDEQLPRAIAQNEARGHAAQLAGQPLGGFLYGLGMVVPVLVDAVSFLLSAVAVGLIRAPLHERDRQWARPKMRRDIVTGARYVWGNSFLRMALLCAAGFQLIFSGMALLIIATAHARGIGSVHIGIAFSIAGVGGILGAWSTGRIHAWLPPAAVIVGLGVVATAALSALAVARHPYVVGALLGCVFFAAAPANAILVATQLRITPTELQARVFSAVVLIAGIAAPIGPLLSTSLFERVGPAVTYTAFAGLAALLTVIMVLSRDIRNASR